MNRSSSVLVYLALTVVAFGALPAAAQWPERPITLVVMYGAGGGTDVVLRTLAAQISESEGWRINVIIRPGAAGSAATRYVLNKRNDGYTLLGSSSFGKFARISGDGDSRSWTDWYYLQAGTNLASWSVRPSSPYKTFADVVAAAKANPGQITISTSEPGGSGSRWPPPSRRPRASN